MTSSKFYLWLFHFALLAFFPFYSFSQDCSIPPEEFHHLLKLNYQDYNFKTYLDGLDYKEITVTTRDKVSEEVVSASKQVFDYGPDSMSYIHSEWDKTTKRLIEDEKRDYVRFTGTLPKSLRIYGNDSLSKTWFLDRTIKFEYTETGKPERVTEKGTIARPGRTPLPYTTIYKYSYNNQDRITRWGMSKYVESDISTQGTTFNWRSGPLRVNIQREYTWSTLYFDEEERVIRVEDSGLNGETNKQELAHIITPTFNQKNQLTRITSLHVLPFSGDSSDFWETIDITYNNNKNSAKAVKKVFNDSTGKMETVNIQQIKFDGQCRIILDDHQTFAYTKILANKSISQSTKHRITETEYKPRKEKYVVSVSHPKSGKIADKRTFPGTFDAMGRALKPSGNHKLILYK